VSTHLYTVSLNEADMLGFFFRHYDSWVDRYYVYDDGSTDGTLDILKAHPRVVLRKFDRVHPDSFVDSHRVMQNESWKQSRDGADWIVVTAIDEHLHCPNWTMRDYLDLCAAKGVTCIPALGYNMIAEEFPAPGGLLCETHTRGAADPIMCKLSLFDPVAVSETGFVHGRHAAAPMGRIRYPGQDELRLLHYKNLGREHTLRRHQFLAGGLRERDELNRWGHHYHWNEAEFNTWWENMAAHAVEVSRGTPEEHGLPMSSRWWRTAQPEG
jgi:hypothetical protein